METVPLSLMDATKMATSRGSIFSRRRLARMVGSVCRRVGLFRIFCGVLREAKSLRSGWAGE